jgi:TonB family protein
LSLNKSDKILRVSTLSNRIMKFSIPLRHFASSMIVVSTIAIPALKSPAQTPAPALSQITAIQAPNSDSAKAAFQRSPNNRPRLLPEGIIQFSGSGAISFINPKSEGNRITLEIPNTTLKDQKPLQIQQPYPGIAQVTIAPLNQTTVQLSIVGEKALPTVAWSPYNQLSVSACSFGFLPASSEFQGEGSTRLLYDVDAAGCPQNIQIAQSSGRAEFDAWAVRELRQRQLQPNRPSQALRLRITYRTSDSEAQKQQSQQGTDSQPVSP